jgi:hypothetical protein
MKELIDFLKNRAIDIRVGRRFKYTDADWFMLDVVQKEIRKSRIGGNPINDDREEIKHQK